MNVARWLMVGGVGGGAALLALVTSCLDDPREGEAVRVISSCDLAALSSDPANAESSLKLYVETTATLLTKTKATEQALREVCNAIDQELGLPIGSDVGSACNPISARITAITRNEPPAPPGSLAVNHFIELAFPNQCPAPPGTLEQCLSKCAGACDTSKCEPGRLAGKCEGNCLGSCTEVGDNLPCVGRCIGQTSMDGGSCSGECEGTCRAPAWTGNCSGTCAAGFSGVCAGTCTGTCNGSPIGTPSDAGPPPSNADGNCPGKCEGVCSRGANGNCGGQCLIYIPNPDGGAVLGVPNGKFSEGFCGGGASATACAGLCRGAGANGAPSTTTCTGACAQPNKAQCPGICRPLAGKGCEGTLTNAFCEGTVNCQQNPECNNACQAATLLAGECAEAKHAQLIIVTDTALHAAMRKHEGKLGKAVKELVQLRQAAGFIGNRTIGDFQTLKLNGDLVRQCVEAGRKNADEAGQTLRQALDADPTIIKYAQ